MPMNQAAVVEKCCFRVDSSFTVDIREQITTFDIYLTFKPGSKN